MLYVQSIEALKIIPILFYLRVENETVTSSEIVETSLISIRRHLRNRHLRFYDFYITKQNYREWFRYSQKFQTKIKLYFLIATIKKVNKSHKN